MSNRELIGFALAFIGGWGGLVGTLTMNSMIYALNRDRPADDQIPLMLVTWDDFRKHWGTHRGWRTAREFHRKFPESPLYLRFLASLVWLASFILAAALTSFLANH
jgi:hypothetical protein